jgi:hypothetical protein
VNTAQTKKVNSRKGLPKLWKTQLKLLTQQFMSEGLTVRRKKHKFFPIYVDLYDKGTKIGSFWYHTSWVIDSDESYYGDDLTLVIGEIDGWPEDSADILA